jgi:SAM-dependent methyltransferase
MVSPIQKLRRLAKTTVKAAAQRVGNAALGGLQQQIRELNARLDRVDAELAILRGSNGAAGLAGPLPPKALMELVGGADSFLIAGAHMLNSLRNYVGLKPHEAILDIGCGVGRTAIHLVPYLGAIGQYRGFDIVKDSVEWCRAAISKDHPNFEFTHADIFNGRYNPNGTERSNTFRFPYADQTFDVAFLDSVFTHMYRQDVVHYAAEITRVLKHGGRCLASFFILDAIARQLMSGKRSAFNFNHPVPSGGFTTAPECPEIAIAFEEKDAISIFEAAGLHPRPPVIHGGWSGRENGVGQQDYLILVKPEVA